MSKYEEVYTYLELNGFRCISLENSNSKIFIHSDGTTVKLERNKDDRY